MPDNQLAQLGSLIAAALSLADRLQQANVAIHLAEAQDALPKLDAGWKSSRTQRSSYTDH
jgi:hypothetical protein